MATQKISQSQRKNQTLAAAPEYHKRGLSVIPLHDVQNGKCTCKDGAACPDAGKRPRIEWKEHQERRAVKITADGWEIVDKPPIIFRRYQNTAAQVEPRRPGNLALLDKYINLDDNCKLLLKVEAISALVAGIPHVIPTVVAEKGAGKSTLLRVRRRLVDPARQELAALPQDKNELALMLAHNYAPAFDNLGGLQGWQSDMLCTASTGRYIRNDNYTQTAMRYS